MATFSPVVPGLRRAYPADGAQTIPIDGLALSNTQPCVDFFGATHSCPAPSSDMHTFSVPLSGFFGAADYYAVHVQVDGPLIDGADCVVQFAPTAAGPCSETGAASYDGDVSPGSWVRFAPDDPSGYVSVGSTFHADGPGSPIFGHAWWPDDFYSGILVNAAPSLPVPAGFYDNYYTTVLFTPAELPAAVDVEIAHTNYLQRVDGTLRVLVYAYDERDDEPDTEGRVIYVGAA